MENITEKKTKLEVFEPAMCCSTGVCGPDVDQTLVDFANDVKWLESQGVTVERYNLGQDPIAFKQEPEVISKIQIEGTEILPIFKLNGKIISQGDYPNRDLIKSWLNDLNDADTHNNSSDKKVSDFTFTREIELMIALGAALASNASNYLEFYFKEAKKAGLDNTDITRALQIAQQIKDAPSSQMIDLANDLLGVKKESQNNGCDCGKDDCDC